MLNLSRKSNSHVSEKANSSKYAAFGAVMVKLRQCRALLRARR